MTVNKYSQLRCKEVVNISDGNRLGYISDLDVDVTCGKILSVIVPGPGKLLGLFCSDYDYQIPWPCIRRIGDDIVLVDVCLANVRRPRKKRTRTDK
ncbi:MAG: YlmC/YmxH family sporulation protein [Oscillospiraceae bacterium]|nr:YlmC/YmxH family sporulation protein [Oscillospiraceae bacterium]MBR3849858.1 YlmC/YmxH family sporulation protein [Oscillospiraceae bacterium]